MRATLDPADMVKVLGECLDGYADSAEDPKYIETVARRGYRLMMPIDGGNSISDYSPAPLANGGGPDEGAGQLHRHQPTGRRSWSTPSLPTPLFQMAIQSAEAQTSTLAKLASPHTAAHKLSHQLLNFRSCTSLGR